jgi:peptidoglycan-associated lipoprotein
MKLKQLATVLLISCTVLALSACASKKHGNYNDTGVSDADGAQAAGIGEGENFGGAGGNMGGPQSSRKNTYYFDFNRSDVREEDKPGIFANANYLIAHSNKRVIVEGHTDPRGSREYNVALAERRANAVADMLKSKGVNPDQIRVVSYGAERLAAPGHSEQDFQLDRRAIIVYQ